MDTGQVVGSSPSTGRGEPPTFRKALAERRGRWGWLLRVAAAGFGEVTANDLLGMDDGTHLTFVEYIRDAREPRAFRLASPPRHDAGPTPPMTGFVRDRRQEDLRRGAAMARP